MKRDAIDLGKAHIPRLFRTYFLPTLLGMLETASVSACADSLTGVRRDIISSIRNFFMVRSLFSEGQ